MLSQDLAQFPIGWLEQILAHVPKEVEMADEIPSVGEYEGNRLADASSHVMDAGYRVAMVLFQLP